MLKYHFPVHGVKVTLGCLGINGGETFPKRQVSYSYRITHYTGVKKKKSKFKNRSNVMSLHRIHNQSSTVMLEIGFKEKGKL